MDQSVRNSPTYNAYAAGELKQLRIVMLEDNPDDALLIKHALKNLPLPFLAEVVTTRQTFIDKILSLQPHLILCDHSLPSITSVEALEVYRELRLFIPFILVTGTVSEEFAVNSIKAGADDYILKSNLFRLPAAIMGALQKRQFNREKEIAEARYTKAERISKLGNWEWDLQHDEMFWSDQIFKTLGLDRNTVTPSHQLFLECVHPDDRSFVIEAFSGKNKNSGEFSQDLRIVLPNGQIRHVNKQADTIKDEAGVTIRYIGTLHDITERKVFEHQLDKERKFLQAVLENINVGIIACSPDGEVTFFNEALKSINHIPPGEDVPYDKWTDYYTVFDPTTLAPALRNEIPLRKSLATGEKISNVEFLVKPANGGTARKVSVNAQPLFDAEGNMLGAVSAIHDCTELKQSEEKLRSKVEELDIFIYKASHDLKGPLSSMAGLINMARLETQDVNMLRYIDMLEKSNHKLENILKDLFEIAHITQGKISLSEINLEETVWDVINSLHNLPNCNMIRFETNVSLKKDFYSDEKLLRGILQNLIHNSINYRNPDNASYILVNAFEKGPYVVIEVKDNGIGIPEELESKVFDMFFRGNYSSTGSGLGLYIVKNAVAKMNGSIELKSGLQEGSTFTVVLPRLTPAYDSGKNQ